MRISDWSSDVCSSDLLAAPEAFGGKTIELGGPDVLSMRALLQWIAAAIGRDPAFVDLPDPVARIVAALPGTPITRDQLLMLGRDNVVDRKSTRLNSSH